MYPVVEASTNGNIFRASFSTFSLHAIAPAVGGCCNAVRSMPRVRADHQTAPPSPLTPAWIAGAQGHFQRRIFTLGAASTSNGVRAALGMLGLDPFLAPPPAVGDRVVRVEDDDDGLSYHPSSLSINYFLDPVVGCLTPPKASVCPDRNIAGSGSSPARPLISHLAASSTRTPSRPPHPPAEPCAPCWLER